MISAALQLHGDELLRLAVSRRQKYGRAQPFPHIVIDGLFHAHILESILEEFPKIDDARWARLRNDHQNRVLRSKGDSWLGPRTQHLLGFLRSSTFVTFVERMTGIDGLIADPHTGGLHSTLTGGNLHIHADSSWENRVNLKRRVNLFLYLNKDWRDEYLGALELWSPDMSSCCKRIAPNFNRLVLLAIGNDFNHGVPDPLKCPSGQSRKAISVTYCSAPRSSPLWKYPHMYRLRPGERVKLTGGFVFRSLVPPIFQYQAKRLYYSKRLRTILTRISP